MSGIVFFRTRQLEKLKDFYTSEINCDLWMDQGDCMIIRNGNFLFGFCRGEQAEIEGILTFFFRTREEVDRYYEKFKSCAEAPPRVNPRFPIYNFFARDPEGRKIEFQQFDPPVSEYLCGDELLLGRRSIRKFNPIDIPDKTIEKILNICRYAPTSRNTQAYYFRFVKDKEVLKRLSELRGKSSEPIAKAPMAAAICSDPELTKRHIQDGCIAAYHFMLTAFFFGLGTCWIAAMDRDDVKQMLGIPLSHYVVTVTPFGYPYKIPRAPERKEIDWFMRKY